VIELLGVPRYQAPSTVVHKPEVGVVNGLAWTEVGGEILTIEATLMSGRGQLTLTGQLGDVMQESAKAALSYLRSRAERFGIDPRFHRKYDLHIHLPEGAIPKDGPSAGIALATVLTSLLCNIKVRQDVAMTGEVTLRGRVLPVGGVKEKVLAAYRHGCKTILLPKENEKDLSEIPSEIAKELNFKLVEHMDEVLELALVEEVPNVNISDGGQGAKVTDGSDDRPVTH
jgi:ATP-dependent Lon protease